MRKNSILENLWNIPSGHLNYFYPDQISTLPLSAQKYLGHAIAPGSPRASAVRLKMHGTIRLKMNWYPFSADQVIRWHYGFFWHAKTKIKGLPIVGFDRFIGGEGAMRWRLLGIIPVITASGPDISRSAIERMQIEAVWIPAVLLAPDIIWFEHSTNHVEAEIILLGNSVRCRLFLNNQGGVGNISILRWGNPDGQGFTSIPFGGIVEEEKTFSGFTIPSKLRIGWYFGTDRFESDGEFFRCTIDEAIYR